MSQETIKLDYTFDEINVRLGKVGDVKKIVRNRANSFRGKGSGEIVGLTDTSPIEHKMDVKVSGKNKVNNNYRASSNGGVSVNGNAYTLTRLGSLTYLEWNLGDYQPFAGETFTLSFNLDEMTGTSNNKFRVAIYHGDSGDSERVSITSKTYTNTNTGRNSFTVAMPELDGSKPLILQFYPYNASKGDTMTISNIQLEEGTTATAYTPYIEDISTVKVKRYGKNIVDNDKLQNADNWLPLADSSGNLTRGLFLLGLKANTSYTISWGTNNAALNFFKLVSFPKGQASNQDIYTSEASLISSGIPVGYTFTSASDKEYGLYITQRAEMVTYIDYMQVEVGTAATAYEPYNATEYAVTTDGTVEGVTSLCPTTTLMSDTSGAIIDVEYNQDTNKVYEQLKAAVIALGGL